MNTTFHRLNEDWNAEPNAPYPSIEVRGEDLVLKFLVNPFQFPPFHDGEVGILRFVHCERYRLSSTNDEAWYSGQCRFSKVAPGWGEFYAIKARLRCWTHQQTGDALAQAAATGSTSCFTSVTRPLSV